MGENTGISWTNSTWTPLQAVRKDNVKRGAVLGLFDNFAEEFLIEQEATNENDRR